MIVLKFGGTSVEDAPAIRRLAAIVADRLAEPVVVVVSALAGVTNALVAAAEAARAGHCARAAAELDLVATRHREVAGHLADSAERRDLLTALESHLESARAALEALLHDPAAAHANDELLATGELLSSHLVTAGLRAAGLPACRVDIRPLLLTSGDFGRARVDLEGSALALRRGLLGEPGDDRVRVTQGFIGATREGWTTTIGRGGSDLSAALVGAALGAREVQIWTDVDGILTTDPRVVPEARLIPEISFLEAAELAYFGAKVLHPSTLRPALSRNIPVRVLNSRRPEGHGTRITRTAPAPRPLVTAIAFKRGITVLNVTSDRMLMAHGFLARLFDVFSRHETAVDMVTTSEVSVSMTLDDTQRLEAIRAELARIGDVNVDLDQAIICLVGDGLRTTPGVVSRIFSTVRAYPVSMISHGASAINLSFVTPGSGAAEVVRALHREFWGGEGAPPGPGESVG